MTDETGAFLLGLYCGVLTGVVMTMGVLMFVAKGWR